MAEPVAGHSEIEGFTRTFKKLGTPEKVLIIAVVLGVVFYIVYKIKTSQANPLQSAVLSPVSPTGTPTGTGSFGDTGAGVGGPGVAAGTGAGTGVSPTQSPQPVYNYYYTNPDTSGSNGGTDNTYQTPPDATQQNAAPDTSSTDSGITTTSNTVPTGNGPTSNASMQNAATNAPTSSLGASNPNVGLSSGITASNSSNRRAHSIRSHVTHSQVGRGEQMHGLNTRGNQNTRGFGNISSHPSQRSIAPTRPNEVGRGEQIHGLSRTQQGARSAQTHHAPASQNHARPGQVRAIAHTKTPQHSQVGRGEQIHGLPPRIARTSSIRHASPTPAPSARNQLRSFISRFGMPRSQSSHAPNRPQPRPQTRSQPRPQPRRQEPVARRGVRSGSRAF